MQAIAFLLFSMLLIFFLLHVNEVSFRSVLIGCELMHLFTFQSITKFYKEKLKSLVSSKVFVSPYWINLAAKWKTSFLREVLRCGAQNLS